MLRDLDASSARLGIESFGLSVTTLEEVFLRLASQEAAAAKGDGGGGGEGGPAAHGGGVGGAEHDVNGPTGGGGGSAGERLHGAALYWQQLRALFTKRLLCARYAPARRFVQGMTLTLAGLT